MKTSKRKLLKIRAVSEAVKRITQRFPDVHRGWCPVASIVIIGSFTRQEERTQYSDIDIGVVFDDQYLMTTEVSSIKKALKSIEAEINVDRTGHQVRLWPKPVSIYTGTEQRDNYFTSLLDIQCNTPEDIFELDGWSGLARNTLLHYEASTGVVLYGEDIFRGISHDRMIPHHEWYELHMISTRDLARGFGLRFKGHSDVVMGLKVQGHSYNEAGYERDMGKVYEGENSIAKAILRNVYARAIFYGTRPLNSYKEILDYARMLHDQDEIDEVLIELVEDAYKLKTKGEGIGWLCAPKNPLAFANPSLVLTAPIARMFDTKFYRQVKQSLFEARSFLPFIEPGNLEIYYERTIPRIINLLATVDIDPLICWLFWEEIRDFLVSDLAILRRYAGSTDLNIRRLRDSAVTTMENIYWFLASIVLLDNPAMRGGQYRFMQMLSSDETATERINRVAQAMLYGPDEIKLNSNAPMSILVSLIATVQILARVKSEYTELLIDKLKKARGKHKGDKHIDNAFEEGKLWYEPKVWVE